MNQNTQPAEGGHGQLHNVSLVELSVVLLANQTDPSILNPDFLRYKKIIDETLELTAPAIVMPVFSKLQFDEEITISADPARFIFEQKVSRPGVDALKVADIAQKFLSEVSYLSYSAIGINPKGIKESDGGGDFNIANAILDEGSWMAFKDVVPEVQLKALYDFERRRITLDVESIEWKDENGGIHRGMLFQTNIHREFQGENDTERVKEAREILSGWKEDIGDFYALIEKFEILRKGQ